MTGKLFFFAIIFVMICSCNEPFKNNAKNLTSSSKISLDSFNAIPTEINDFSCYYSQNKDKFKRDEYLFACNSDSLAFISVNRKMIKLKLASTTRLPGNFTDNDHTDIYSNDKYKVTVVTKYDASIAEDNWWNKGTIIVESKNDGKVTYDFIGTCGYRK